MYLVLIKTFSLILENLKNFFKFFQSFNEKRSDLDPNNNQNKINLDQNNNQKIKNDLLIDTNQFQYEPVIFESFVLLKESIKNRLSEKGYENSILNKNLEIAIAHLSYLYKIADKCCCGLVKANGLFSVFKVFFKILQMTDSVLNSPVNDKKFEQELNYFERISKFSIVFLEIISQIAKDINLEDEEAKKKLLNELSKNYPKFHQDLKMFAQVMVKKRPNSRFCDQSNDMNLNSNNSIDTVDNEMFNSLPLFSPHLRTIVDSITEAFFQTHLEDKYLLYSRTQTCAWIDRDLQKYLRIYCNILPFLRVRFYQYFHLIFSSDYRAKICNQILTFPNINFPFELWNLLDKLSFLHVKLFNKDEVESKELFLPHQSSIVINQSETDRLTINDKNEIRFKNEPKIRCKYIKSKNIDLHNCSKLLVNFHGGGFLAQSADGHEPYLRKWANYSQIPILSVDYRVKKTFPNGLQDCFDVYLWLKMAPEEEIRTKLGFYPKQIILEGDSAGGNLAFGIALVLHDLKLDYKNKFNLKIDSPNGIVCIYTPFLTNFFISPSRALSALDPMVNTGAQLMVADAISGNIPGLRPNTSLEALKTFIFTHSDPVPWFVCNQNEMKERIESRCKYVASSYLNSIYYDKYDSLTDVPLHLVGAEFCSFLDEGITIAKLWKGPIKCEVLPDTNHGFLNLIIFNKKALDAAKYCCQKIIEMFEDLDSMKTNKNL